MAGNFQHGLFAATIKGKAMREHEINNYWKRIVHTMSEGLILIGPEGTIITVNRAFEEITGYKAAEIIGKPCTLMHCDACEGLVTTNQGTWCKLFDIEENFACRCHIRRKDGMFVPVMKNAAILKDESGRAIGAVETLTDMSEMDKLERKYHRLVRQLNEQEDFCGLVGRSPAMQAVYEIVQKAAQSDAPVMIYGPTGTGKELVAHAIHSLGGRQNGPFVQLNCAALNESLLESELFGHVKGAFTGAYQNRQGRFEAADKGDLFLDEIGDIPLSIQVKLLRVLETKQFERVGDHSPVTSDVRIIAATNRNLEELIRTGKFREDLFFRINVIPIQLPSLTQRKEDIPLLVNTFIKRLQKKSGKMIRGLSVEAMDIFMQYDWPGNVRELKSALEYAFVVATEGLIRPDQLPRNIVTPGHCGPRLSSDSLRPSIDIGQVQTKEQREKAELVEALRKTGGNQTQAARLLGINRVTVWNRMKKYGLDLKRVLLTAESKVADFNQQP